MNIMDDEELIDALYDCGMLTPMQVARMKFPNRQYT